MNKILGFIDMLKKNTLVNKIYDIFHFITKVILYALFVFFLFIGFVLVTYFVGMQRNLKSGHYEPPLYSAFIIISPSMHPSIKVNDAVIVKKAEVSKLKKGDIITFNSTDSRFSGATITHRIVDVIKDSNNNVVFRTKGDNNNVEDSTLVRKQDLVGKVILKIPLVGYIQYFLSTSFGWIMAIVIPCLGIIIYDIIKLFKAGSRKVLKKKRKD